MTELERIIRFLKEPTDNNFKPILDIELREESLILDELGDINIPHISILLLWNYKRNPSAVLAALLVYDKNEDSKKGLEEMISNMVKELDLEYIDKNDELFVEILQDIISRNNDKSEKAKILLEILKK